VRAVYGSRKSDSDAHPDPDTYPDTYLDSYPDAYLDTYPDAYTKRPDAHAHTYSCADPNAHADSDSCADPNAHADAYASAGCH